LIPGNTVPGRPSIWYSPSVLWQLVVRRLRGEGPLGKQQPHPKNGRRRRVEDAAIGGVDPSQTSRRGSPRGLLGSQGDSHEKSKYRILRKKVMRRCRDTGQGGGQPPPRSSGAIPRSRRTLVRAECHISRGRSVLSPRREPPRGTGSRRAEQNVLPHDGILTAHHGCVKPWPCR